VDLDPARARGAEHRRLRLPEATAGGGLEQRPVHRSSGRHTRTGKKYPSFSSAQERLDFSSPHLVCLSLCLQSSISFTSLSKLKQRTGRERRWCVPASPAFFLRRVRREGSERQCGADRLGHHKYTNRLRPSLSRLTHARACGLATGFGSISAFCSVYLKTRCNIRLSFGCLQQAVGLGPRG
jgi:hypothetical protein